MYLSCTTLFSLAHIIIQYRDTLSVNYEHDIYLTRPDRTSKKLQSQSNIKTDHPKRPPNNPSTPTKIPNGKNCDKKPPNPKNLALKNTKKHNFTISQFLIP
mmetsp:Transcript_10568/g.22534  ORF Transcript_10568/g.22534 Transcript_10568/m.22534 type:complete len:101 (+) Transcript_10568:19-321(+)